MKWYKAITKMINRDNFFASVRESLYGGKLTAKQVEGINAILNEAERRNTPKEHTSYVLATVYHETAKKMQPVTEYGGEKYLRSKPYYPYYGRDLVHTTWLTNYEKVKAFTGVDVVAHPELIAELSLAVKVAFEFMQKGWYTGKKLSDYINDTKTDYVNARKIINGTDKAELIASYAIKFQNALRIA